MNGLLQAFLPAICQRNGFNPTFRACRFLCLAKGRGFGPLPKKEGKNLNACIPHKFNVNAMNICKIVNASNKQATKDDISSRTESRYPLSKF
ncbi:hypothetical protein AXF42_Ash015213 [Apostasia shenzhenica]|uniref:Uncharacterized protein n=1 Tax=Apostasia shenzhenica TaxID=1088818 RepID=A0A2I0AQK9_9ASPA|nr:hypothetical protein AXF42_Ash015213 [Apostasia shenzhenica]